MHKRAALCGRRGVGWVVRGSGATKKG